MPTEPGMLRPAALLERILDFNLRPLGYADPGRLGVLLPEGAGAIAAEPRAAAPLSRWILDRMGIGGEIWIDFDDPGLRLALLDREELAELARHAGLAVNWPWVTRLIQRDQVRVLKDGFGEEAYRFCLDRAPELLPEGDPALRVEPGAEDAVSAEGWHLVCGTCAGAPPALTRRLLLKLPREIDIDMDGLAPTDAALRIAREVRPQWAALLA